ncbi:MAG TPA: M13 family metallopeptidase [Saprospiraceae bacterium]|nr:M13 family metallopeptidase [Saprospiraceae bacterium]
MAQGINHDYLDLSVKPGEDFYMFVNGGWMKTTEIPEDRSSWGSFHELAKTTDEKVLKILDEELMSKGPAKNKAARLFESGMNTSQIEKTKLAGLKPIFQKIESLQNVQSLPELLGILARKGLGAIIHFSVHPDLGDSKKYAAYLEPGILGLPERDFYIDDDEKARSIRDQYVDYISHILNAEATLSAESAKEFSQKILELETSLANSMMSKEQRRQIELLYNPHTQIELLTKYPSFDWKEFFKGLETDLSENVIVTDTEYFKKLNENLNNISLDTLKHYLVFMAIHHAASYVHSSLEEKHFELFSKKLDGVEKMRPRRERIVKVINQFLGEALGELFVSQYFPGEAKATALEMVDDIVVAFKNRIQQLDWMGDNTKAYATEKLNAFRVKIGYPENWKDYDDLQLSISDNESSYFEDLLATVEWKFKKDALRIGKEVDREEWFMAPQVVNAYYNPMFNEIVFPAAILQPPFFDWHADAAVNYGGIGAVIGHEITHGFDDQGSRFDKEGNLNEWWTEEDRMRFKNLTNQLVEQFDGYLPFEDLPLNGAFTLGENIADLGGLSVAYDALQLYYKRHGKPESIDGFTPDQRFFMSWATVWRTKTRPEALRTQIKTDPHPPGMYRAIAAPSNLDSFYSAFEIYPESPWYRKNDERIKIW